MKRAADRIPVIFDAVRSPSAVAVGSVGVLACLGLALVLRQQVLPLVALPFWTGIACLGFILGGAVAEALNHWRKHSPQKARRRMDGREPILQDDAMNTFSPEKIDEEPAQLSV